MFEKNINNCRCSIRAEARSNVRAWHRAWHNSSEVAAGCETLPEVIKHGRDFIWDRNVVEDRQSEHPMSIIAGDTCCVLSAVFVDCCVIMGNNCKIINSTIKGTGTLKLGDNVILENTYIKLNGCEPVCDIGDNSVMQRVLIDNFGGLFRVGKDSCLYNGTIKTSVARAVFGDRTNIIHPKVLYPMFEDPLEANNFQVQIHSNQYTEQNTTSAVFGDDCLLAYNLNIFVDDVQVGNGLRVLGSYCFDSPCDVQQYLKLGCSKRLRIGNGCTMLVTSQSIRNTSCDMFPGEAIGNASLCDRSTIVFVSRYRSLSGYHRGSKSSTDIKVRGGELLLI